MYSLSQKTISSSLHDELVFWYVQTQNRIHSFSFLMVAVAASVAAMVAPLHLRQSAFSRKDYSDMTHNIIKHTRSHLRAFMTQLPVYHYVNET